MHWRILSLLLLLASGLLQAISIEDYNWRPKTLGTFRLGAEFAGGRFIAIDQNYGGVTFFAVPGNSMNDIHPVLDVRAFKLENSNWASSVGLGLRKWNESEEKVYGINVFYDYLNNKKDCFNQWGVGLELLSRSWEFHINGYIPVGKKAYLTSRKIQGFPPNFVSTTSNYQFALAGVEATAGGRWRIADGLIGYVAPGLYYYRNSSIGDIQGIQCNMEIDWKSWVSVKVNASYDSRFKTRVQGILAISIPVDFSCTGLMETCESMILGRSIRRNDMIFLKRCCTKERNWDDCGLPLSSN